MILADHRNHNNSDTSDDDNPRRTAPKYRTDKARDAAGDKNVTDCTENRNNHVEAWTDSTMASDGNDYDSCTSENTEEDKIGGSTGTCSLIQNSGDFTKGGGGASCTPKATATKGLAGKMRRGVAPGATSSGEVSRTCGMRAGTSSAGWRGKPRRTGAG